MSSIGGTYALQGRIEVTRVTQVNETRIKLEARNAISYLEFPPHALQSAWND